VAVLTNADGGMVAPAQVANMAAAVAIGKPFPERKAIAMDTALLDAYAGTYKADEKVSRTVRREQDHLVVQRSGRGPIAVYPFEADSFFMKDGITVFKFGRDTKGQVAQLTLDDDGAESVSVRSGDAAPERKAVAVSNAALDGYSGRYELVPGFVIELSRDGDKFYGQATGQQKFHLVPVSNTAFYVKEVDAEIRFDNGNDQLVLLQGGRTMPAKRIK
jgi:D-alanyl-D-alanine carboxypeptidase